MFIMEKFEKILNNPGFQHLAEDIFWNLDYKHLQSCREINQSAKRILDNSNQFPTSEPLFMLKNLFEEVEFLRKIKVVGQKLFRNRKTLNLSLPLLFNFWNKNGRMEMIFLSIPAWLFKMNLQGTSLNSRALTTFHGNPGPCYANSCFEKPC